MCPVPGMHLDPAQTPSHLEHRQRTMWLRQALEWQGLQSAQP